MSRIDKVVKILDFIGIGKSSRNSIVMFVFQVKTIKSCEESEGKHHYTGNYDMKE